MKFLKRTDQSVHLVCGVVVTQPDTNEPVGPKGKTADYLHGVEVSRPSEDAARGEVVRNGMLSIVFGRLYVLRNQLVHGGATWNSDVNRDQVRDGAAILACLLPIFVDLMMDHPAHEWAMPHYPVVD